LGTSFKKSLEFDFKKKEKFFFPVSINKKLRDFFYNQKNTQQSLPQNNSLKNCEDQFRKGSKFLKSKIPNLDAENLIRKRAKMGPLFFLWYFRYL